MSHTMYIKVESTDGSFRDKFSVWTMQESPTIKYTDITDKVEELMGSLRALMACASQDAYNRAFAILSAMNPVSLDNIRKQREAEGKCSCGCAIENGRCVYCGKTANCKDFQDKNK